MALVPKTKILQAMPSGVQVADGTGDYDSLTNPGGWGTPNPNRSSLLGIMASFTALNQPESVPYRLSSTAQTAYIYQGGVLIPPPAGMVNPDGVYSVVIRLGMAAGAALSSAAGSYDFTLAGASTIFATADGFSLDGIDPNSFYKIDRTKPLTATGGSVTTPLPNASAAMTTVYLPGSTMALIYQTGEACLTKSIADYAGLCGCCEGEDLTKLMNRYAEYLSMLNKFNTYGDYAGADAIAKKLQRDCVDLSICAVQGLQPNVPFTGNVPVIIVQPVNQTAPVGSEVSFSVVATGTQPLKYQWYRNGILDPNGTGSTYTILNAQLSDSCTLYCVVSNAYGSATSVQVSLTIGSALTPVTITQQPQSQGGTIGGSVTFSLTAAGSPTITYQWYKGGTPISGATANSLTLSNIQQSDVAAYYCVVTNPVNSVQSVTVNLTIGVPIVWGWTDNAVPTSLDLFNAQGQSTITSGSPITADYRANTQPKTLFMAESLLEPIKTRWWGNANNNGPIGDPNNDLFIITQIGSQRVYYTVFPTLQTETVIQFLTANQQPS